MKRLLRRFFSNIIRDMPDLFSSKFPVVSAEPKTCGQVVGQKYNLTMVVDGLVFYTMAKHGTDDDMQNDINRVVENISSAKIEVIR